jgi:hypothetical protein
VIPPWKDAFPPPSTTKAGLWQSRGWQVNERALDCIRFIRDLLGIGFGVDEVKSLTSFSGRLHVENVPVKTSVSGVKQKNVVIVSACDLKSDTLRSFVQVDLKMPGLSASPRSRKYRTSIP